MFCLTLEPERGNARGGKMTGLASALAADLKEIRKRSPLVLNITNYVAMDLSANTLLALGASPIMAHEKAELTELITLSEAIVLNLGTLDLPWIDSMHFATQEATKLGKRLVLDPVGAGATILRTQTAHDLLGVGSFSCVRGNASEISALLGQKGTTKGVESALNAETILGLVQTAAQDLQPTVVVSGETDFIFHEKRFAQINRGTAEMTKVTAMGCTASSVIGAFLSVNPDPFQAAVHAMSVMGICGERAKAGSNGPGSFRVAFVDAIGNFDVGWI